MYKVTFQPGVLIEPPRSVVDLDSLIRAEAKDLTQALTVEIGRLRKRGGNGQIIESLKELRLCVKELKK